MASIYNIYVFCFIPFRVYYYLFVLFYTLCDTFLKSCRKYKILLLYASKFFVVVQYIRSVS